MITSRARRFLGASLVVPIAMLAMAASASAAHHPTGAYAKFAQCPLENPLVEVCVHGESHGQFQFGDDSIPAAKAEIFQGGYYTNPETGVETFVGPVDGEILAKVNQLVPAGFLANVRAGRYPWYFRAFCKNFPENEDCRLTTTPEVVGPITLNTTNLLTEHGIAVEMPIRFQLHNPFFGGKCYVGSPTEPIMIKFTTGTTSPAPPNLPITGSGGKIEVLEGGNIVVIRENDIVENNFSIPVANGCGGPQAIIVDKEFNEINELPVAAGDESMVSLLGNLYTADASAVRESE